MKIVLEITDQEAKTLVKALSKSEEEIANRVEKQISKRLEKKKQEEKVKRGKMSEEELHKRFKERGFIGFYVKEQKATDALFGDIKDIDCDELFEELVDKDKRGLEMFTIYYDLGISCRAIGEEYDVSEGRVGQIIAATGNRVIRTAQQIGSAKRIERLKEAKNLEELRIGECGFSVRTFNCLKRAEVRTIGDITSKTLDEMMRVRNLGKKSLKEITDWLERYGLKLKEE